MQQILLLQSAELLSVAGRIPQGRIELPIASSILLDHVTLTCLLEYSSTDMWSKGLY